MAKFYDTTSEERAENRAALSGDLNVPETAKISKKNPEIASWTDMIEIVGVTSETKENENSGDSITTVRVEFDFHAEGTGVNTGVRKSVWHSINNSAYYERRDREEWQYKFARQALGTLESLLTAAELIGEDDELTGELMDKHFGGESDLPSSRVMAMMTQKPQQMKSGNLKENGKPEYVDDLSRPKRLEIRKYMAEEK